MGSEESLLGCFKFSKDSVDAVRYLPRPMNHPEIKTSDLIKLYRSGLGLREIAAKVGISYQGVHERLRTAGVGLRGRGAVRKPLDPETATEVADLYCGGDLPMHAIADRLGVSVGRVRDELEKKDIKIRGGWHYLRDRGIERLEIGESIEYDRSLRSDPRYFFYRVAARNNFKVRVNKLGGGRFRVTRVE
jgi:predicted DNA-binding protein YlxM (UPF0122 family)